MSSATNAAAAVASAGNGGATSGKAAKKGKGKGNQTANASTQQQQQLQPSVPQLSNGRPKSSADSTSPAGGASAAASPFSAGDYLPASHDDPSAGSFHSLLTFSSSDAGSSSASASASASLGGPSAKSKLKSYLLDLLHSQIKLTDDFSSVCRAKVFEKDNLIADLQAENQQHTTNIANLQRQLLSYSSSLSSASSLSKEEKRELEEKIRSLRIEIEEKNNQVKNQKKDMSKLKKEKSELQSSLDEGNKKMLEKERALQHLNQEVAHLKESQHQLASLSLLHGDKQPTAFSLSLSTQRDQKSKKSKFGKPLKTNAESQVSTLTPNAAPAAAAAAAAVDEGEEGVIASATSVNSNMIPHSRLLFFTAFITFLATTLLLSFIVSQRSLIAPLLPTFVSSLFATSTPYPGAPLPSPFSSDSTPLAFPLSSSMSSQLPFSYRYMSRSQLLHELMLSNVKHRASISSLKHQLAQLESSSLELISLHLKSGLLNDNLTALLTEHNSLSNNIASDINKIDSFDFNPLAPRSLVASDEPPTPSFSGSSPPAYHPSASTHCACAPSDLSSELMAELKESEKRYDEATLELYSEKQRYELLFVQMKQDKNLFLDLSSKLNNDIGTYQSLLNSLIPPNADGTMIDLYSLVERHHNVVSNLHNKISTRSYDPASVDVDSSMTPNLDNQQVCAPQFVAISSLQKKLSLLENLNSKSASSLSSPAACVPLTAELASKTAAIRELETRLISIQSSLSATSENQGSTIASLQLQVKQLTDQHNEEKSSLKQKCDADLAQKTFLVNELEKTINTFPPPPDALIHQLALCNATLDQQAKQLQQLQASPTPSPSDSLSDSDMRTQFDIQTNLVKQLQQQVLENSNVLGSLNSQIASKQNALDNCQQQLKRLAAKLSDAELDSISVSTNADSSSGTAMTTDQTYRASTGSPGRRLLSTSNTAGRRLLSIDDENTTGKTEKSLHALLQQRDRSVGLLHDHVSMLQEHLKSTAHTIVALEDKIKQMEKGQSIPGIVDKASLEYSGKIEILQANLTSCRNQNRLLEQEIVERQPTCSPPSPDVPLLTDLQDRLDRAHQLIKEKDSQIAALQATSLSNQNEGIHLLNAKETESWLAEKLHLEVAVFNLTHRLHEATSSLESCRYDSSFAVVSQQQLKIENAKLRSKVKSMQAHPADVHELAHAKEQWANCEAALQTISASTPFASPSSASESSSSSGVEWTEHPLEKHMASFEDEEYTTQQQLSWFQILNNYLKSENKQLKETIAHERLRSPTHCLCSADSPQCKHAKLDLEMEVFEANENAMKCAQQVEAANEQFNMSSMMYRRALDKNKLLKYELHQMNNTRHFETTKLMEELDKCQKNSHEINQSPNLQNSHHHLINESEPPPQGSAISDAFGFPQDSSSVEWVADSLDDHMEQFRKESTAKRLAQDQRSPTPLNSLASTLSSSEEESLALLYVRYLKARLAAVHPSSDTFGDVGASILELSQLRSDNQRMNLTLTALQSNSSLADQMLRDAQESIKQLHEQLHHTKTAGQDASASSHTTVDDSVTVNKPSAQLITDLESQLAAKHLLSSSEELEKQALLLTSCQESLSALQLNNSALQDRLVRLATELFDARQPKFDGFISAQVEIPAQGMIGHGHAHDHHHHDHHHDHHHGHHGHNHHLRSPSSFAGLHAFDNDVLDPHSGVGAAPGAAVDQCRHQLGQKAETLNRTSFSLRSCVNSLQTSLSKYEQLVEQVATISASGVGGQAGDQCEPQLLLFQQRLRQIEQETDHVVDLLQHQQASATAYSPAPLPGLAVSSSLFDGHGGKLKLGYGFQSFNAFSPVKKLLVLVAVVFIDLLAFHLLLPTSSRLYISLAILCWIGISCFCYIEGQLLVTFLSIINTILSLLYLCKPDLTLCGCGCHGVESDDADHSPSSSKRSSPAPSLSLTSSSPFSPVPFPAASLATVSPFVSEAAQRELARQQHAKQLRDQSAHPLPTIGSETPLPAFAQTSSSATSSPKPIPRIPMPPSNPLPSSLDFPPLPLSALSSSSPSRFPPPPS